MRAVRLSWGGVTAPATAALLGSLFLGLKGYPTHNDIVAILQISDLPAPQKWVNGFYGPGYTALTYLVGANVFAFGAVHVALFIAVVLWGSGTLLRSELPDRSGAVVAFCLSVLGLFLVVSLNYSDGIFVGLVLLGMLALQRYFWAPHRHLDLVLAALFLGAGLLFRHHGILFAALVLPALWLLNIGWAALRQWQLYAFFALAGAPALVCWVLLERAGLGANWQIFNAYRFVAPVDWYAIPQLIEAGTLEAHRFSLAEVARRIVMTILGNAALLFGVVALLVFPLILTEDRARRTAYLAALGLIALYVGAILPSVQRGLFPLYGVLIIVAMDLFVRQRAHAPMTGLVLTALFLLGLGANGAFQLRDVGAHRLPHAERLLEALEARGIPLSEVFTDDFDLYLPDRDFLDMQTFGGWANFHSDLRRTPDSHVFEGMGRDYAAVIVRAGGYLAQNAPYMAHIDGLSTERLEFGAHRLHFVVPAQPPDQTQ